MFFFLAGVFMGISRSYTLGNILPILLIAVVHFLLLRHSKLILHQKKIILVSILIGAVVFYYFLFIRESPLIVANFDRISSLVGSEYGATDLNLANLESRKFALKQGFQTALENPLGRGFGIYLIEDVDYQVDLSTLLYHSLPLTILYTLGILGSVVFFLALISILTIAFNQFRRNQGINSVIAGVVFSYIFFQLIAGFGGNTLLNTLTLFPLACAALQKYTERKSN
jgi:hypothetical protein